MIGSEAVPGGMWQALGRKEQIVTGRRVKAVAVMVNLILLGLTFFVASRPGFEIEGITAVLFLMVVVAPVVSILALCWPHPVPSALPAPNEATKGQG